MNIKFPLPLVELKQLISEVSQSRCVELVPDNKYKILGVRWYAKGAFIKSESSGGEIKANRAYLVKEGDFIYNRLFAWKGSFAIIPKELDGCYVSNEFPIFSFKTEKIVSQYLLNYLSIEDIWDKIELLSKGVSSISRNRLKVSDLLDLKIPLPSINAQQSVVSKIEMIKYKWQKLTELQDKNGKLFSLLRQAILQEAVQGKLVPQDPADEPASELLKRIKTEKDRLIREGKIKREKPLPPIPDEEIPYELPEGWVWVRFPEIGELARGKSKNRPRNDPMLFANGKYPFVQTGDVARSNGKITTYSQMYNDLGLKQSRMWKKGTLCITIAANIAETGILKFDACFPDSVVGFIPSPLIGSPEYFEYFLRVAKNQLVEYAPSTAQKNINLGILEEILIPIPPLNEQKRIVAKVDELMRLCDELEERIRQSKEQSERLMQAAWHEAFEGKYVEESNAEVSVA